MKYTNLGPLRKIAPIKLIALSVTDRVLSRYPELVEIDPVLSHQVKQKNKRFK